MWSKYGKQQEIANNVKGRLKIPIGVQTLNHIKEKHATIYRDSPTIEQMENVDPQ